MAMAISNVFHCPKSPLYSRNRHLKAFSPNARIFLSSRWVEFNMFAREQPRNCRMVCSASSAAGSSNTSSDENPYEVLGVNPIEGFDAIKVVYTRKRKDAERRGDETYTAKLERAYDKIMMAQLQNRKKGLTFGSFKELLSEAHANLRASAWLALGAIGWAHHGILMVSKDIKYADKQPIVPWGPRFAKSSVNDMRINMAISALFTVWVAVKGNAEYKPLQFLAFVFVYRIFMKLKASEPPVSPTFTEAGEDEGRTLRMGKRLLRSLALVFGCIAVSSLAFTGVLNLIEFLGQYIPVFLYNNQELFVTASTAVMLYIIASYYR